MRRALKITGWVIASLLLCGGVAFAGLMVYMHRTQPQLFADPLYDSVQPQLPELTGARRILVFSKTNGFRHTEAIPAANALLGKLAAKNHWAIFFTENAAVFNAEQLATFDAVVWNNASGPLLTPAQQQVFEHWLQSGHGYLGIHGAGGDTHYDWRWYVEEVLRAQFVMHPLLQHLQTTRVNVEMPQHPVMAGIESWSHTDEWYNFEKSPRSRVTVLASLDESTYSPEVGAMGADHPIVWSHTLGEGRVVYSALGHSAEAYSDPNHQKLLENALSWVLK